MDYVKEGKIEFCNPMEQYYPVELKNCVKNSSTLYYRGDISIINAYKNVAVVGSRKCSENGLKASYETGQIVAQLGLNLVNGLAIGCDTEAIRGALSMGGRCICILPCGLDLIQPKVNKKIAEEIIDNGGCLLSEYPIGTPVRKYQYVERDRLQSGISQGVLIIEAEEKSGTMHTIEYAQKQKKRLACYSYHLLKNATANKYLEEQNKAQILKQKSDVLSYLKNVQTETYEQITLPI